MKTTHLIKTTIALSLFSLTINAANLNVTIDKVNSSDGKILAQVFKGKENYKNGKPESSLIIPAKKGENTFSFQNLEHGEYAVRLFHDINNNNDLDTNVFGMPTEGYGFSNQAVGNFGPAKYKDMVVVIADDTVSVDTKVKMIY